MWLRSVGLTRQISEAGGTEQGWAPLFPPQWSIAGKIIPIPSCLGEKETQETYNNNNKGIDGLE